MNGNTWFLIFWFLNWFTIWGVLNFFLIPSSISYTKKPYYNQFLFVFGLVVILSYHMGYCALAVGLFILIPSVVIFNYSIHKAKYHLYIGMFYNILFQQVMIYSLVNAFHANLVEYFLIFFLGHFPVVLVPHLKLKYKLILICCALIGGASFFHLVLFVPSPVGNISAFLLHSIFYLFVHKIDPQGKTRIIV